MPDMDGVVFLSLLRRMQPQCVRVLMSGAIDHEGALSAVNDAQVEAFLAKPWHEFDLKGRLALAMRLRRMPPAEVARAAARSSGVLIVGDDPGVTVALAADIETAMSEGLAEPRSLYFARNVKAALGLAEEKQPEVIFCDGDMAGGDGGELLHALRRCAPAAVLALVAGRLDTPALIEAINVAGVYHFLSKPWHAQDLRTLFAEAKTLRGRLLEDQYALASGAPPAPL